MRWPWVSRAVYDRLEWELAREREESSRRIDALMAAAVSAMDEAKAERQSLLDRIVQLSGQPALYKASTQAPPAAETAAPTSNLPAPRAVATFSDIHAATREAMNKPNFRPDKGAIH
jgi:hypothetical protein